VRRVDKTGFLSVRRLQSVLPNSLRRVIIYNIQHLKEKAAGISKPSLRAGNRFAAAAFNPNHEMIYFLSHGNASAQRS
jgi:hypothetical protein